MGANSPHWWAEPGIIFTFPRRCQCRMGALWGKVCRAKGPFCAGAESFAEGFRVLATSRDSRAHSSSIARGAAATWRTRYITLGAKGPVNPVLLYGWPWTLFYCEAGNDQSQKPEFGEKTARTMGEGGSKGEISQSFSCWVSDNFTRWKAQPRPLQGQGWGLGGGEWMASRFFKGSDVSVSVIIMT